MRRLITIPVSHYCEKARWALDHGGLEYVEEAHLQGFHYLWSYPIARTPFVPILVDGDRVIKDSTAILHHVDAFVPEARRLFPEEPLVRAEVEKLEERFDLELGPPSRAWAYWEWFGKMREMLPYVVRGTSRFEQAVAPFLIGGVKTYVSWRLGIDAGEAQRSLDRVRTIFDDVTAILGDGRRFLAGDRFTAADLTFASLGSPVLLPPGYGVPMPSIDEAPPKLREEIGRLRATPAGALALRLYAEHRGAPASRREDTATAGSTTQSDAKGVGSTGGTPCAADDAR